ncbi:hypothetical protein K1514_13165 [Paraclostridium bifermentans]|uniref:hypothetical protein n=1 Tax=Paraclostridium TaxID=1849822 RepID=UPI001CC7A6A4|nr:MULTISPECIES: hypothetical protein [Paraclostridium]MBZ6006842.1 hypothetical protein [Paraclostridium bifermentans]MDU0298299.1 hypothetical protein [Paraclostridium sp. MRS3W1]
MHNLNEKYRKCTILEDKMSRMLEEKLKNGEITQHEYDELKSLDVEYDEEKDSIEQFKVSYIERKPIKCSRLLLDIYDKHKTGFRKAVLLSECFPDPLGFNYNQEIHEFNILIVKKAFNLATLEKYPKEILFELRQLY